MRASRGFFSDMPRSRQGDEKAPQKHESAVNSKSGFDSPKHRARAAKLLHDVFDDLEVGLANVMPTGAIIYCNRKFSLILGIPPHRDLFGMKLQDFITPHSWQPLETALHAATQQPVTGEIKLNTVVGKPQTIRLSMGPATIMRQPVIRIVADEVTELWKRTGSCGRRKPRFALFRGAFSKFRIRNAARWPATSTTPPARNWPYW